MRDRVQKKRALALERARKEEMVLRLHEDRLIRQEVNERLHLKFPENLVNLRTYPNASKTKNEPKCLSYIGGLHSWCRNRL